MSCPVVASIIIFLTTTLHQISPVVADIFDRDLTLSEGCRKNANRTAQIANCLLTSERKNGNNTCQGSYDIYLCAVNITCTLCTVFDGWSYELSKKDGLPERYPECQHFYEEKLQKLHCRSTLLIVTWTVLVLIICLCYISCCFGCWCIFSEMERLVDDGGKSLTPLAPGKKSSVG